jgi:hypothetical protein
MRARVRLTYAGAVLFLAAVVAAALFSLSPQPLEARHLRNPDAGVDAADAAVVASPSTGADAATVASPSTFVDDTPTAAD